MWNVPRLFRYSLDHFRRQFLAGNIHPAVVLAIARENGIPSLIKPAVEALAEPTTSLHSWCCEGKILRYIQAEEIGVIARMKERLYDTRLAILDVPPVIHGDDCTDIAGCALLWEHHWYASVGKKVRKFHDGTISHQLWFIRSTEVLRAEIPGMKKLCLAKTVESVADNWCWYSDKRIVDGAIEYLMVTERIPDWSGVGGNSQ